MATISESKEEVLAAVEVLRSEIDEDALEHHGIKGMKWGVRNSETLRKYGLLKGASAGKAAVGRAANAIAKSVKQSGANVRKASAATVKAVKAKVSGVKQQKMGELSEKKHQYDVDKARSKELGMSKRKFDELREKTLKSHDPSVVAKGMHTLTDAELNAKLNRLTTESKLANLGYTQKQTAALTRKKQFEAIKESPVYDILSGPAKTAANKLIVETMVDKGLQPVLDQRTKFYANKVMNSFENKNKYDRSYYERGEKGEKAFAKQIDKYKDELKAKSAARDNSPERQAALDKKSEKYANQLTKQRERERAKQASAANKEKTRREAAQKQAAEFKRFNDEYKHYQEVKAEGDKRNRRREAEASKSSVKPMTSSEIRNSISRSKAAYEKGTAASNKATKSVLGSESESRQKALDYLDKIAS